MKLKMIYLFAAFSVLVFLPINVYAQGTEEEALQTASDEVTGAVPATPPVVAPKHSSNLIFDDKMLLEGYTEKYKNLSKEILVEMMKDDTLSSYKSAAAVRAFNENYALEVVSTEKKIIEKILIRRLNRTTSPFVEVEVMYTLCKMDRYRYFNSLVPALIQKLDHYNSTVNDIAYNSLDDLLVKTGSSRAREARIVFNVLRKMLFLSRKRLTNITEPGPKLSKKLRLLRWSIKVLGTEEIQRLPKEVLNLI